MAGLTWYLQKRIQIITLICMGTIIWHSTIRCVMGRTPVRGRINRRGGTRPSRRNQIKERLLATRLSRARAVFSGPAFLRQKRRARSQENFRPPKSVLPRSLLVDLGLSIFLFLNFNNRILNVDIDTLQHPNEELCLIGRKVGQQHSLKFLRVGKHTFDCL
ncbi:MAG: hypothetical protein JWQ00_458 [Noviherbaspirillum sp.]|nr:hypothetical protein [Noviherbaspirillum sp.]